MEIGALTLQQLQWLALRVVLAFGLVLVALLVLWLVGALVLGSVPHEEGHRRNALDLDRRPRRHPRLFPGRDTPRPPLSHPADVGYAHALRAVGSAGLALPARDPVIGVDQARDEVRARLIAQQERARRELHFQRKGF